MESFEPKLLRRAALALSLELVQLCAKRCSRKVDAPLLVAVHGGRVRAMLHQEPGNVLVALDDREVQWRVPCEDEHPESQAYRHTMHLQYTSLAVDISRVDSCAVV